jgi:hypothetical protein
MSDAWAAMAVPRIRLSSLTTGAEFAMSSTLYEPLPFFWSFASSNLSSSELIESSTVPRLSCLCA